MKMDKTSKNKHPVVYAFIDSQNLNLGTNKDIYKGNRQVYKGWKLDYKKFRKYLSDKFRVSKALLFIGYAQENGKLYRHLKSCGYDLVYKPTTKDREGKPKGNVDAELVLYAAAIEYNNYDKAVIVSGDGISIACTNFLRKRKSCPKLLFPIAILSLVC